MTEPESVHTLRRKLEFLRVEEAKATDPEIKFKLIEAITETEAKLARRQSTEPSDAPKLAPTRLPRGAPELFGRVAVSHHTDARGQAASGGCHERDKFGSEGVGSFLGDAGPVAREARRLPRLRSRSRSIPR